MVMRDLIRRDRTHPVVRARAEEAVASLRTPERVAEVQAVYDWITQRSDYRRDPNGAEWLQAPWALLACQIDVGQRPQIDCDDFTDLSLAMLESLGHETAIHVVSQLPSRAFNHVYGLDYIGPNAVRVDLVEFYRPPGATPPDETRTMTIDVNGNQIAAAPWWSMS
jgi:hypothetical protein